MLFSLTVSSSPCGTATHGSGFPDLVAVGPGMMVRLLVVLLCEADSPPLRCHLHPPHLTLTNGRDSPHAAETT
jgi:hypothetical protein